MGYHAGGCSGEDVAHAAVPLCPQGEVVTLCEGDRFGGHMDSLTDPFPIF